MAAVIDLRTGSALAPRPGDVEERSQRPRLTVLEGGRSAAAVRRRRTFLRRRLVVAAGLLAVVIGCWNLSSPLRDGGPAPAPGNGGVAIHQVAPGDTLWGVAASVDPQGDPRAVIDRIIELNSTGDAAFSANEPLRVGQTLRVPAGG